ncbi:Predicted phosphoribosyltransferase [Meinhardsimonia xiamenensis]|uniref:Predicted phosphoribosyltransferase n=1 Tax=Meinhardsimonia xiamenensis TaxID=990712 RepID=A0A1G8ZGE8_9RHOB|nr:phosphoribosyltransferase [Meinhardsimonia xiamenensis]PRX37704.1 putative phosphoribosyltransferase [Meinhardsimonia xiamenensis]SDK14196.1 Predicted phosphoribosyltransferase [Meinhardsimonia xiamenensis]
MKRFADREEAGQLLAERLAAEGPWNDPVVLALPRGGVPVARPVADRLGAPLDLLLVRKIGAPGNPELAVGAVVDGTDREAVWNDDLLRLMGLSREDMAPAVARALAEIEERRRLYLGDRAPVPVEGRDVIVIDDGIATGATMRAALRAVRRRNPASVTLAVPVAPADTLHELRPLVDRLVCLAVPEPFHAVGLHYEDFRQTTDEEVRALLARGPEIGGQEQKGGA